MTAVGETGAPRLHSLDALRGFDMFWIAGGSAVFAGLASLTDWPVLHWIERQCEHAEWHGFTFWDLIFPLFLFLAGVAMPFSLTRRVERGDSRGALRLHVVRRGLVLVLLGLLYNGLLRFEWSELRCASVLGRIGLAYLLAGLIVLHARPPRQALWAAALLLGYWALMTLVPVPGHGAGVLEPGASLADHLDQRFLPGRLHREVRDPEGLLATLPAVATALIGALAGQFLRARLVAGNVRTGAGARVGTLAGAGVLALVLGALWHTVFPINKNLWTSSFVLWTAGWSLLLLALFHLLIDVWDLRKPFFFFVVIGLNPITIYMAQAFVDFDGVARVLFARAEGRVHAGLMPVGGVLLRWVCLYALWRRGWFLRV